MKELLNVLVADSDTAAAERIRLLLEQNGCFVQTTSDGQKVLAQLTDGRYDLLLLSLALQCLDGYAVLSSLSELRLRRYPFVAVHTAMGEQAARRALSLGADIALLKPCCDAELLSLRQQAENMPSILSRRKAEQVFPDACRLAAAIGVPERMKGFQYLACAVSLCYADDRLFSHATGMLYPRVAEKFGTTPGGVEHAIRQSIESTWTYGSVEPLHAVFGNSVDPQRGKPTNIECIALLAEQLRKIESE